MHRIPARLTAPLSAFVALAALAAPAAAQTQEKSDLAWGFAKGDTHTYDLTWDLKVTQGLSGPQPMPIGVVKVKVVLTLAQTIEAVEGVVADVKAKISGIQADAEAEMMGMPLPKRTFDSKNVDGADPTLSALSKALEQTITFKVDRQGKVSQLKGGDEIATKIEEAMAAAAKKMRRGGGGGGGMGGMGGMGGGMGQETKLTLVAFQSDSLTSGLNMVSHVLPSGPKAQGDTWSIKQSLGIAIGVLDFEGAYKHTGAVKGKVRIGFKNASDVTMKKVEGAAANPALANLDFKVTKSEIKGLATFGEAKLMDSEATMEVETEGDLPDMLKQQMQMMGGGAEGAKLAIGYKLTLRYVRAESK